jgi:hypothetical protein
MLSNSLVAFSFLFLSICTVFDWNFSLLSASASGGMPPSDRSGAGSGPSAGGAQNTLECHDPQDPSTKVERGDRTPAPMTVPETNMITTLGVMAPVMASEAAAGGPTAPPDVDCN